MRTLERKLIKISIKNRFDYGLIGQDYYDGIPDWIKQMSPEELEMSLEEDMKFYPPYTEEEKLLRLQEIDI